MSQLEETLRNLEASLLVAEQRATEAKALKAEFEDWKRRVIALGIPRSSSSKKRGTDAEVVERVGVFIQEPSNIRWSIDAQKDRIKAERTKAESKQKELDRAAATEKLTGEAIEWLTLRGKKINEDFTVSNAIQTANGIAFTEEVAKRSVQDGYVDFAGQNCDEPCDGWDGHSHRCQCGNRRVDWTEGFGHSFKSPDIYAEAY